LEPPAYGPRPRQQRSTDPFLSYLRERLAAYPGLTAVRLWRELRERGYAGGYTAVKRTVRDIRPEPVKPFEVRFETPPGAQAQVDLAHFEVVFADEPGVTRIVWLFSLVLGFSRLIWARFVVHQDLQTILRCHIAALEAIGGAPQEILYDRMKTAVIGEDADGLVVYNRGLLDLARHYGFQPRACRPYRPKTKGKVERPFRYIREDFFLGGAFRNLDDLNAQLRQWLDTVANPRVHATTQRIVNEAFAEERPALKSLPLAPYRTVLKLERRVSHEGMVSVGGNLYSVPDTTRRRILDVHVFADEIRIFENGAVIAVHAPLEGRDQKHVDPDHRKVLSPPRRRQSDGKPIVIRRAGDQVARRSLDFYQAVARRLADQGGAQ
jgi:transposase